jgi:hypothetical protein
VGLNVHESRQVTQGVNVSRLRSIPLLNGIIVHDVDSREKVFSRSIGLCVSMQCIVENGRMPVLSCRLITIDTAVLLIK